MKRIIFFIFSVMILSSCKLSNENQHQEPNKELAALFARYYDERMSLFPLEATANGDNRFNDQLYPDFTHTYRIKLRSFYSRYFTYLTRFERDKLNDNDKVSYDVFKKEMEMKHARYERKVDKICKKNNFSFKVYCQRGKCSWDGQSNRCECENTKFYWHDSDSDNSDEETLSPDTG